MAVRQQQHGPRPSAPRLQAQSAYVGAPATPPLPRRSARITQELGLPRRPRGPATLTLARTLSVPSGGAPSEKTAEAELVLEGHSLSCLNRPAHRLIASEFPFATTSGCPVPPQFDTLSTLRFTKLFYKRECQEKYFSIELKPCRVLAWHSAHWCSVV